MAEAEGSIVVIVAIVHGGRRIGYLRRRVIDAGRGSISWRGIGWLGRIVGRWRRIIGRWRRAIQGRANAKTEQGTGNATQAAAISVFTPAASAVPIASATPAASVTPAIHTVGGSYRCEGHSSQRQHADQTKYGFPGQINLRFNGQCACQASISSISRPDFRCQGGRAGLDPVRRFQTARKVQGREPRGEEGGASSYLLPQREREERSGPRGREQCAGEPVLRRWGSPRFLRHSGLADTAHRTDCRVEPLFIECWFNQR